VCAYILKQFCRNNITTVTKWHHLMMCVLCIAIVLVMPDNAVDRVLLAASRVGLVNGQRAFILLGIGTALNATSDLAMTPLNVSLPLGANASNSGLKAAAESLLVIKAHSISFSGSSATSYKVGIQLAHCK